MTVAITELKILPIDLKETGALCCSFREDAFVVSFGSRSKFYEEDGKGAERYLKWLKNYQKSPLSTCAHVWYRDRIIGQLEIKILESIPQCGFVHLFYLIPEFRNKGLGISLQRFAEDFFKGYACRRARLNVSLTNTAAIRFYEKHGWIDLGEQEENPGCHLFELLL